MLTPCLWNHSCSRVTTRTLYNLLLLRYVILLLVRMSNSLCAQVMTFSGQTRAESSGVDLSALCCMPVRLSLNLVAQYLLKHGDEIRQHYSAKDLVQKLINKYINIIKPIRLPCLVPYAPEVTQ